MTKHRSDCHQEAIFFMDCLSGNVEEYNNLSPSELSCINIYMKTTAQKHYTIKSKEEMKDFIFTHNCVQYKEEGDINANTIRTPYKD